MGFFSWKLADSGKTLWNKYTKHGATPCKVLCPDGRTITELDYDGYGRFDGNEWADLVAEYCGDGCPIEWERRALAGEDIPIPKIVSLHYTGTWEDTPPNQHCDTQGYWGAEA